MKFKIILLLTIIALSLNAYAECVDEDENYFTQGIITDKNGETFEDFCIDEFYVYEYICDFDEKATTLPYRCDEGCEEGACLGGKPISEKGQDIEEAAQDQEPTYEELKAQVSEQEGITEEEDLLLDNAEEQILEEDLPKIEPKPEETKINESNDSKTIYLILGIIGILIIGLAIFLVIMKKKGYAIISFED